MTLTLKVRMLVERLNAKNALVIRKRWGNDPPTPVTELKAQTGLTKQRIHQIEKAAPQALQPELADTAKHLLDTLMGVNRERSLTTDAAFNHAIRKLVPGDDEHARLARRAVEIHTRLVRLHGMRITKKYKELAENLPKLARRHADSHGIIRDTEALRAALPDDSWREHWHPWFTRTAGMSVLNGIWVMKHTTRSKVKTLLIASGVPLTRDQIAKRYGLSVREATNPLHETANYARTDATHWTLTERVTEPYKGAARMIEQEIKKSAGGVEISDLITTLADKWGVGRETVVTACRNLLFERQGGRIRMRDVATITGGRLTDAMHGLDRRKRPYWTFPASKRHLAGYSITFMPTAIAKALGCLPQKRTTVDVHHAGGTTEASVSWPLTNNKSTTLGRMRPALKAIEAKIGQRVRIAINPDRSLEISINDPEDGVETESGRSVRQGRRGRRPGRPKTAPRAQHAGQHHPA